MATRSFKRAQFADASDPRQLLQYIRGLEDVIDGLSQDIERSVNRTITPSDLSSDTLAFVRNQLQSNGYTPLNLTGLPGRSSDYQNPYVPYLLSHPDPLNTELSEYIYTGVTPNERWSIDRSVNPPVRRQIVVSGSVPANMMTTDTAQNVVASKTFTVNQLFDALISKYNAITTVKNGVPAEYAFSSQLNKTANIAFTTLYTTPTPAAYMYRVSAYLATHTTGTAGSQVNLGVRTNDGIASKTFTTANVDLTANNYYTAVLSVVCAAATVIDFTTTGTYNGAAAYDLYLVVEAL